MTDEREEITEAVLSQLEVKEAEHPTGLEMTEWAFTNDLTNPAIRNLFHMLHQAAFVNKLGVMHALHKPTGTVQSLIVGVEVTDNGVLTWPLAKILTETEQTEYLAPDGNGNFPE